MSLTRLPSQVVYPTLTSLLQPASPTWLRPHISRALSLLPLRSDGIRQVISFIANSAPRSSQLRSSQEIKDVTLSSGPAISLEVTNHASKLLSSVPSSISTGDYFRAIAPQLLDLLDEESTDMQRVAAYIVGIGVLGQKRYGAPGSIGWELFAMPIFRKISPPVLEDMQVDVSIDGKRDPQTFIAEKELLLALQRLSALVLIHPNPGLTKRLIRHIVLPLWGLLCFAADSKPTSDVYSKCIPKILSRFFKLSAGEEGGGAQLATNLLWDGTSGWMYKKGPQGNIEICQRLGKSTRSTDAIALMHEVEGRVYFFLQLVETDFAGDEDVTSIFLNILRRWLGEQPAHHETSSLLIDENSREDPFLKLIYAKIVQEMLRKFKDKIAAESVDTIKLVQQLLDSFLKRESDINEQQATSSKPSMAGLSSIAVNDRKTETLGSESSEDSVELVSVALSILSAIFASPDFVTTQTTNGLLIPLQSTLARLMSKRSSLPTSLTITASNISTLISLHTSFSTSPPDPAKETVDPFAADRKTHNLALTYLAEPLVPVRAEGLSLITGLIHTSSPILDIPSTAILLLSLLQDEEEFIYLAGIKSLGILASKHPKTLIRMLVEKYVDREEDLELDQRLRVGEALRKTVEGLGTALVGDVARTVGEGMIAVGGKRGMRIHDLEEKRRRATAKSDSRREAEQAWGGEVPDFDDSEPKDEISERLSKVLEGWEGKDGEEDVRIRTSALSILGSAVEANLAGMGSTIVSTAIDLGIAILKFETIQEKTILRRAAVLIVMSLIKALDKARDEGQTLGFGFAGESLQEVVQVMRYIQDTDSDDVVLGHVQEVIESLEIWQSKSLLGISKIEQDNAAGRIGHGSYRLAGLSVSPDISTTSRPRIEEIE